MDNMPDIEIPREELKALFEPLVPHTTGMSFKYEYDGLYYVFRQYYVTFKYIEMLGCKKVLDFGFGIGAGSIVYDNFDWDFEIEYCDIPWSWSGDEKSIFEFVHDSYGVEPPLRVTSIFAPVFTMIDEPSMKYDCVLTLRFPPISQLKMSPLRFKEIMAPYCEDDFFYLYSNVKPELSEDKIWFEGPEGIFTDRNNGFIVY